MLLRLKRHADALGAADQALMVHPETVILLHQRGLALAGLGRHGEPQDCFVRAATQARLRCCALCGGLLVWDVPAPRCSDFGKFSIDQAAVRDFLTDSQARSVTVPYRANRAAVFDFRAVSKDRHHPLPGGL